MQYIRGSIQRAEIAKAVMAEQVQQYNEEIERLNEYLGRAGRSGERSQTQTSGSRVSFVQSTALIPGAPASPSFGGLSPVLTYPLTPTPTEPELPLPPYPGTPVLPEPELPPNPVTPTPPASVVPSNPFIPTPYVPT